MGLWWRFTLLSNMKPSFFTIADMAQSEIEDLGIKYREEVELEDIVITHTHVNRNDIYKLFCF